MAPKRVSNLRSAGMVSFETHAKLVFLCKCLGMGRGECATWLIEAGLKGIEEKLKATYKKAGK
jgi:hypothetical protein